MAQASEGHARGEAGTPEGFDSAEYWRARYRSGNHSGSGSYGRLAVFKAHVVNLVVHRRRIRTVVEFGSGDGAQASLFAMRRYTGIDVSEMMVGACRQRFADRRDWRFMTLDAFDEAPERFDMSMSLDVIYHLIEDEVFDAYMRRLFTAAGRFVLIYASNHDAATEAPHVRHRAYSSWIASEAPGWRLAETVPQAYPLDEAESPRHTSFAFFMLYEKAA